MRNRTFPRTTLAWLLTAALAAAILALFLFTTGQTQAQSHISTQSTRLWGIPANGQYFAPDQSVHVRFQASEAVNVPDGVGITLEFVDGDGVKHTRFAAYNSILSTDTRPVFEYEVQDGDPKADKIAIGTGFRNGSVVGKTDSSKILHFYGDDNLQTWEQETGEVTDPASYGVDGRPKVTGVDFVSNPSISQVVRSQNYTWTFDDYFRKGQTIHMVMGFDQPVDVEGNVCISMRVGTSPNSGWRGAWHEAGSGSDRIVFAYTVQTHDLDTDGAGLDSGGGSDRDSRYGFCGPGKIVSAGMDTETSYGYTGFRNKATHKVDGRPYITNSKIVSEPQEGDTYWTGEKLQFALDYSEPVDVSGEPTIDVYFDYDEMPITEQKNRKATYESGSGTGQLVFAYEIQETDKDLDGAALSVGLGPEADYGMKGGKVTAAGTEVEANNYFSHIADDPDHKVDGSQGDRIPPEVESITLHTTDNYYSAGETIQIDVTFSENVRINADPEEGSPISLTGVVGDESEVFVYLQSLSTSDTLRFGYRVEDGDNDADGISLTANAITLHGSTTLRDSSGNDADLSHDAVSAMGGAVDTTAPTIDRIFVSTRPDGGASAYKVGHTIGIGVSFTEKVTVTGTPQLQITIGTGTVTADLNTHEGHLISFDYEVVQGDADSDGVSVAADSITLNGGTITDAAGNDAVLTHTAYEAGSDHGVDGSPVGGI